ncbi:hypothetical protein RUM43_005690 [Polyplax serrata]|uniref:Ubiquitin conjugation factor E4 A n=1 Tax=Polyplax serrata TaxID=468196 RepID=A0AAN8P0C3_POLSC
MWNESGSLENNPFAYLFPTLEEARKYSVQAAAQYARENLSSNVDNSASTSNSPKAKEIEDNEIPVPHKNKMEMKEQSPLTREERISNVAEKIFGVTLNKSTDKSLLWLEEFASDSESNLLDPINLEQILFERLLLEEPSQHLLNPPTNGVVDSHVLQKEVITYLVECYSRLIRIEPIRKNEEIKKEIDEMKMLVLRNAATALRQPELYENQNLNSQVLQIFYDSQGNDYILMPFINGIVSELIKDEENVSELILTTFVPIFDYVHRKIANCNIINFEHVVIFLFLHTMASNKYLAGALIDHSTPKSKIPGSVFSDTLLGAIFCLSCLPKVNDGPYEFFDSLNLQASKTVEDTVWTSLSCICDNLHQLFLTLLKASPEVKHKTLQWFSDCLFANADRGKLGRMNDQAMIEMRGQNVSDGFMLNMSAVLLRLCQPFVTDYNNSKILKIDPTYCAAKVTNAEEAQKRNCHMHDLHLETCILPTEEGQERPVSGEFNFITECYFMAQKSLDLGFRVCAEKVNSIIEELSKIQQAFNDAVAARGANHEVTEHIQEVMQSLMSRYLSIRAALIEPKTLDLLMKLHATSANWLIQTSLKTGETSSTNVMKPLQIPLPEEIPTTLKCIPEFILLNLTCFLSFTRRYNRKAFEENGFHWLEPILSVITIFMGSAKRISNPHLRAGLAEAMEALLPNNEDDMSMNPMVPLSTICREQLFKGHPLSRLFIPSLLNVFVSIEMTGQSVQFEEKFKYRRPMYVIMDYLWSNKFHRECFKNLADDAEKNIEAVTPPLFLRFVNLLINDAVFLLDEALANMAKLKTLQAARESGEWTKLPMHERRQNEALFMQAGMHAKFDNILGRWTIHTLEFLTSEIMSVFLHPVMVDRVAAMLNYFLQHLVGPNKKNFKVKDKEEYKFKPEVFVMDICKIYVHLYQSDDFCLAISKDGRSYNKDLFRQAQDVLARIGGGALIGELKLVDEKVSLMMSRQMEEDEMLPDAPDDFLDPIMSTLMRDPVILPSSQIVVDRTTIARHLLSDESDPFNRSPLTLDKVIPHPELRKKIENWLEERRKVMRQKAGLSQEQKCQNQEDD